MLTYCLVIFLGLGLTSYLVTSNMVEILTDMESRFDSEVIQKVQNYGDERYQDFNRIFARLYQKQYFNNNTSIIDFINPVKEAQRDNSLKSSAIRSYLQDTCSANTAIADILLVDYHDHGVYFFSNVQNRDVSIGYDFFRYDFIGDGTIINEVKIIPNYIPDYINSASVNNFPVISFKLFLFDENAIRFDDPLGVAVVNVRADFFRHAYKDSSSFLGRIFVIGQGGFTLFDSAGELTGQPFAYERYQATGLEDLQTNSSFVVNKRYSEKTGFTYIDVVDKQIIARKTDRIRGNINNIIAICLLITLAIGLVSAFMLSKRIKTLVRSMKAVEKGKLDTHITVGTRDEIGYLEQSFNSMCAQLSRYIRNVYISEIKTKTAELRALQAQVDPHFLFNTLESIRTTAQMNQDYKVAKMVHLLGNMFRWNIKTTGIIVDLKEEIDYVRSYIELQKMRFDDAFDVQINIENNALKLGILKLTLQPIVENAIQHGLDGMQSGGLITIDGFLRDDKLVLRVSDNGKGMNPDKVAEITASLSVIQEGGVLASIGLCNVHQRNCILFGEGNGLNITSAPDEGTQIEISLPAMTKEEMKQYVQGTHR
ncbi:MAG TPA: sensor histidine kinase [Candidatus Limiplasma sp.]|nr:sensor histidine kinase [Candidatus Limiplasma sp.]HRX08013.1 sensor histidine kinase [Candidatus Limiplasma sp.]